MNEIIFATGNSGKAATLESHLAIHNLNIRVVQRSLELIEPQATTATEVARMKARQAYDIVKKPVLVDDSSFHISALGGFPGPYVKYMNETVGAEGIVRFMENQPDRSAYFVSALVFIDEYGKAHEFTVKESTGTISNDVRESIDGRGWSELWRIFIPAGSEKTLSQMTKEDHDAWRHSSTGQSAYDKFTEWIKTNTAREDV